jgi:hypothetical protein
MTSNAIENTKVLRFSRHNNTDWTCCVCTDQQQHTRPFLTRENDLVCAGCISSLFKKAVKDDADYPARWGSEELNPHDFPSILSQFFTFLYCWMGEDLAALRAAQPPEPLEGQVLGVDYQLCPVCTTAISLTEGCNHMICRCGTSFCFICGLEAGHYERGHWTRKNGCPRYNSVGSGQERWDHDSDDMDISDGPDP